MKKQLNLLIVEDNPDDADLILAELRQAGFDPHWKRVETELDFLAEMEKSPEIILSDYSMPRFTGLRAAELLQKSGLNIPFILISGTVGEDIAVEAMKKGVNDYLLKDRIARLGPAVQRALLQVEEKVEHCRLEAQFIEAQKMEVVGQLAAGVAHDFNNILAVIMGYSDVIAAKLPPESPLRKYAAEIQHASDRAVGLTRQLLIMSRKQTVQPIVLDLNEVVKDMDKMLRRLIDENVEMSVDPGRAIGAVKADPGYVGQVLMNLVVNARDAMPNGGKLKIATENITLGSDDAEAQRGGVPGDYVVLTVSDTGTGMSEEVKARLFEAFFTTKPVGKGTGLGLATCQTIVQQSGGHIAVFSELGRGSTFKVYFPRVDLPLYAAPCSSRVEMETSGTETLLVVEDEPSLRHLVRGVLEAQGYEVLSASNGQEALHVVRDHGGAPIRLVVTDVIMPVMGGQIMAEWLKTSYPDLKILFTSGYTDEALSLRGVCESGMEFLPKPYTPAALSRKVRQMLDGDAGSCPENEKGNGIKSLTSTS